LHFYGRGAKLNAPTENDLGLINQAPTNLNVGVRFIEPKLHIGGLKAFATFLAGAGLKPAPATT
jgi:hypothetical protein